MVAGSRIWRGALAPYGRGQAWMAAAGACCWAAWAFSIPGISPSISAIFVLAYAMQRQRRRDGRLGVARRHIGVGVILLVGSVLLYLPFYVSFRSQAGGHRLGRQHQDAPAPISAHVWRVYHTSIGRSGGRGAALWADSQRRRRLPLLAQLSCGAAGLGALVCLALGWWTAALIAVMVGGRACCWFGAAGGMKGQSLDATRRRCSRC